MAVIIKLDKAKHANNDFSHRESRTSRLSLSLLQEKGHKVAPEKAIAFYLAEHRVGACDLQTTQREFCLCGCVGGRSAKIARIALLADQSRRKRASGFTHLAALHRADLGAPLLLHGKSFALIDSRRWRCAVDGLLFGK